MPKNGEIFHTKDVWYCSNRLRSAAWLFEKSFFENQSLQQQVPFAAANTHEQPLFKFIPHTWLRPEFGA